MDLSSEGFDKETQPDRAPQRQTYREILAPSFPSEGKHSVGIVLLVGLGGRRLREKGGDTVLSTTKALR